ncbi:Ubiquitin carboxyl-terminal hydrolase 16 [Leucoagaricus sp. SymC.cos]|nr:Ubiquitin carboxyl-terminal hydrolase 16 [Leucoagaricus sp. SymC.cos]
MPIGDQFIEITYRAWRIQSQRKRESLSPKDLLAAVGRKYDQYLDFAQQDAHEFLRILLDAMRMEEQDVIKKRQPPPPKQSRKHRRSSQLNISSTTHPSSSTTSQAPSPLNPTLQPPQPLSEADILTSFSDMVFGGKLTSILVCQKCKHISQTYEDFNDISLSLKPEDYAVIHSRKRDRFKNFAKKLAAFPSTSLASAASGSNSTSHSGNNVTSSRSETKDDSSDAEPVNDGLGVGGSNGRMAIALSIQRSSSVPPSPREREDPQISDKLLPHLVSRRRSMEHLQSDLLVPPSNDSGSISEPSPHPGPPAGDVSGDGVENSEPLPTVVNGAVDDSDPDHKRMSSTETKEAESDGSNVLVNENAPAGLVAPEEKHVGFAAEEKPVRDQEKSPNVKDKKKRDGPDSWTKISRRISLTVKLGRRDKDKEKEEKKEREKEEKKEKEREKKERAKEKEKGKEKAKVDDDDAKASKDKKSSRTSDRRFSGLPGKPKSPSSVASPLPDVQSPALVPTSGENPPTSEIASLLPSPSIGTSTTIVASSSSPGALSLSPADPTSNDPSKSQPPIAMPVPLRSFSSQSHNVPRLSAPLQSIQSHMQSINTHVQAQVQKVSGIQRSKSPKPPKQTKEEQEYLRRILADVAPIPVSSRTLNGSNGTDKGKDGGSDAEKGGGGNPLSRRKTSTHLHIPGSNSRSQASDDHTTSTSTSIGTWLPLAAVSQFSGLEECLRMFTAVEVLDGENMVGCRRCWKIQNGYVKGIKDEEDSDDEDEEGEREFRNEGKEKLLAPPLQSFDSQSSTTSTMTFASAESGDLGMSNGNENVYNTMITASPSQSPVPLLSMSTPTLVPSSTTFSSDTITSTATPRLPHRSSSTPIVEQVDNWSESTLVTPRVPSALPPPVPPKTDLHHYRVSLPSPPSPLQLIPNTPGGLPIPRISTTPAADSSSLDGIISGAGVEDVFIDNHDDHANGSHDDEASDSGTRTPITDSSRSSLTPDSTDDSVIFDEVKKRHGMVFRDSLVVPSRMPGKSRPRHQAIMMTTDGDSGLSGSEAESVGTSASFSRSGTPTEESESEEESGEESVSDAGGEPAVTTDEPLVPPGLGSEPQAFVPPSTPPPLHVTSKPANASSPQVISKPLSKPKKKKETILRPAYKRYLISVPPPVLVIHLKRFQQLNPSSSSALSSFAEKIAAGFSSPPSAGRGASYGGGFGGFGGIGGGGFKKLEEFVSFPEWLDLGPFLAPKKEDIAPIKATRSQSREEKSEKKTGVKVNGEIVWRGSETRDKDGRCMYRLYAVVVHIGNMLGGHYVAYVALPDEPPLSESQAKETDGEGVKDKAAKNSSGENGTDHAEKQVPSDRGSRTGKRQWAYISDTTVRSVSFEEVLNARAYICMYERV